MAAFQCSFMDLLGSSYAGGDGSATIRQIIIPNIQRDYAQGRKDPAIAKVRERFLDTLKQAVTGERIVLDFVYGDVDANGIMTPLDGQQRLTTLFLLHWYASKKEQVAGEESSFLQYFSYETRYSTRDFCKELIDYCPDLSRRLSEDIMNQPWFPYDWGKDPSIQAMLVMLDAIQARFEEVSDIWLSLKNKAVSFYFLPIREMGLTDALYINMNSRGKPLTQFEHFKAELERKLMKLDEGTTKRIIHKIDIDWTDMLWKYRGQDDVIDDEFLRYFGFICDVLCYQQGGSAQNQSYDGFDLLDAYFSPDSGETPDNILVLEKMFDCWCHIPGESSPESFLNQYLTHRHQLGKVKIDTSNQINVFQDCLRNYGMVQNNRNRAFPLTRFVLLYAIVQYLIVCMEPSPSPQISPEEFTDRLRVVNNLIQNSEFEIRDSGGGSGGNRMPEIIRQVKDIVLHGIITKEEDQKSAGGFNNTQIEEEEEKRAWLKMNPEWKEALYRLEDHDLLYGQIGVIGLQDTTLFQSFEKLFDCDYDKISCAMLANGAYGIRERNGWRYQLGAKTIRDSWRTLFHGSSNEGFDQTKTVLKTLLNKIALPSDSALEDEINAYISRCESASQFDWRYYFIKYDVFRPNSFGKYQWNDYQNKPYEMSVLLTRTNISQNTYQPFLKAVDGLNTSPDSYGQKIIIGDYSITCSNNAYLIYNSDEKDPCQVIPIEQNDVGIDTEDRILKMRKFLKGFLENPAKLSIQ